MSDGSHRGEVAADGDAIRQVTRRRTDGLDGRHSEPLRSRTVVTGTVTTERTIAETATAGTAAGGTA